MIWLFNWFVKITAWIPQAIAFRRKVYYEDKKAQGRRIKGKAILVSNHYSVWDYPALIFTFCGRTLRCQIAEIMYQKNFIFTWFLKALGGIKVDRDAHDFTFVGKSRKILDNKGVLTIFPESRIPKEGEETPLPFKPSAVYIALESGAPIIPVAVNGKYFQKERSRILIGKPIDVQEWYQTELSEKDNIAMITEKLRERIIELKDELDRRTNEENSKKEKKKK